VFRNQMPAIDTLEQALATLPGAEQAGFGARRPQYQNAVDPWLDLGGLRVTGVPRDTKIRRNQVDNEKRLIDQEVDSWKPER
jgi:hypothetical protein